MNMNTIPSNIAEIVSAFSQWYLNDPHSTKENAYAGQLTKERLAAMSEAELAEFFFQFAWDGGKVQSGGERTAGGLRKSIQEHSSDFRAHILKPFDPAFDVPAWLQDIKAFKGWGKGIATIYLNRVDPKRFVVVNNKSIEAYQKLGYAVRDRPLEATYDDLDAAQRHLLKSQPALGNLFRADAFSHFLIGTDTGKALIGYEEDAPDDDMEVEEGFDQQWHKYKWLRKVARSDWEFFLDECAKALSELGLDAHNERVVLNMRNNNRKRMSLNLLTRVFLAMCHIKETTILVQLKSDAPSRYPDAGLDRKIAFKNDPKTCLFELPIASYRENAAAMFAEMLSVARELIAGSGPRSRQRMHHIPDLFPLVMDAEFRQTGLDFLLDEKGVWPGGSEADQPNYWIFQGSPNIYDTAAALQAGVLSSWKVSAHKDKLKVGDKAIIWITGKQAGCYALATITSAVEQRTSVSEDAAFYKPGQEIATGDQVSIRIDHDLSSAPIAWVQLKDLEAMNGFKAGNQGTTFQATKQQYDTILNMAEGTTEYFTHEDLALIEQYAGRRYDKKDPEHQRVYADLKITYSKVGHWAKLVQEALFPEGRVEMRRNPTNQAITFEAYQWARIYPWNGAPKELAYTLSIQDSRHLVIQLNTAGIGENDIRRRKYLEYRGPLDTSHIALVIPEEEGLPLGWEGLVDRTVAFIRPMQQQYEELARLLGLELAGHKVPTPPIMPLNTILYGPPGTGKTHTLKNDYFERFTTKPSEVPREQRIFDALQDLTWWEVIGTVLLDLGPSNVDAIMAHELTKAKAAMSNSKNVRATMWSNLQFHTVKECVLVMYEKRSEPLIFNKRENSVWEVVEQAVDESYPELREHLKEYHSDYQVEGNEQKEVKRYEFVTFHQAYTYEDFIEGLKPTLDSKEICYEIVPGLFKRICERAEKDPDHEYALFIDEINRGNIAAIFGELITLIEEDKRLGAKNELRATLPYSKPATFGVPANVRIIGTMNTADRSVEALDTALRRRFSFEEFSSKPELLNNAMVSGVNLTQLLTVINARIEMLVDRDHHIGHSYFMNLEGGDQEAKLRTVFKNNVVPLLQEYFFGDPVKVGMVLGPAFVQELNGKDNKVSFAKGFTGSEDIEPRPRYVFSDPTDRVQVPIQAFIDICDGK